MTHSSGRIRGVWPYADPHALARFTAAPPSPMAMTAVSGWGRLSPTAGTAATADPAVARCSLHTAGPTSTTTAHQPARDPHRCDIRPCVNPAHLKAGTQAANISDTVARGGWTTIARLVADPGVPVTNHGASQ